MSTFVRILLLIHTKTTSFWIDKMERIVDDMKTLLTWNVSSKSVEMFIFKITPHFGGLRIEEQTIIPLFLSIFSLIMCFSKLFGQTILFQSYLRKEIFFLTHIFKRRVSLVYIELIHMELVTSRDKFQLETNSKNRSFSQNNFEIVLFGQII